MGGGAGARNRKSRRDQVGRVEGSEAQGHLEE